MSHPGFGADLCLKCNICTAACPVAAVTDAFPGPKAVGPQAERFRHPRLEIPDQSVALCSGCGVCSRVCPHGVPVTEINIQAKARLASSRGGLRLRDHLISRPAGLGRLAAPVAPIANAMLSSPILRWAAEKVLGISRQAPLPGFSGASLRSRHPQRVVRDPQSITVAANRAAVAYFHGCSAEHYELEVGQAAIDILERLGCQVILPPQVCCGLPLQSNGFFRDARRSAQRNLAWLAPFAAAGIPIVGSSTSCTLALKHDYAAILQLDSLQARSVAANTYDIFEFITGHLAAQFEQLELLPLPLKVYYHPPCQLKAHAIGLPALRALRRIPELTIEVSESECCGVAGTYGVKAERYALAAAVGGRLFHQAVASGAEMILTDSETCRWWLAHHCQMPAAHPLMILARALKLE
jgi:glycerol-3-phosphate dehydrogenase subunit C